MLAWSQCSAVKRLPGKVSGASLFKRMSMPVESLFQDLECGASVSEYLEWFPGVMREQVEAVLAHARHSLVEA